jgi:gas vesicle protein
MSYAGPSRGRGRSSTRTVAASAAAPSRPSPGGRSPSANVAYEPAAETDWQQVAIFGAGVALGIAVGAGAALLTAPQSGAETRAVLRARVGRVKRSSARRGRDAWEELRHELRSVKRAFKRRKLRRAAEHDLRREMQLEALAD